MLLVCDSLCLLVTALMHLNSLCSVLEQSKVTLVWKTCTVSSLHTGKERKNPNLDSRMYTHRSLFWNLLHWETCLISLSYKTHSQ